MVKFRFVAPTEGFGVIKVSTQRTGKLNFSKGAVKMMQFEKNPFYKLALNAEDKSDSSIYLVPAKGKEADSYKAGRAGAYYYMRAKGILDELKINYETENIVFSIEEIAEGGVTYFRLTRKGSRRGRPTGSSNKAK